MKPVALAAALAVAGVSAAAFQDPRPRQTPTFRSSVTLVTIDVTVLDKDGRPVPGLTAEDFQVKLNGRVQPVRAVSYVQVAQAAAPLTAADLPPEVTGRKVITNAAPTGEPKVFVLVIDDLSFPAEGGHNIITAAEHFVNAQPRNFYIGMAATSGAPIVNPTLDRGAVIDGLKHVAGVFVDPRRQLKPDQPSVGISESIDIIDHNDLSAWRQLIQRECSASLGSRTLTNPNDIGLIENQCAQDAVSTARMIASQTRGTTSRQVNALRGVMGALKGAKGLRQMVVVSAGIGVTRDVLTLFEPLAREAAEAGVQLSFLMDEEDTIDLSDPGQVAPGGQDSGLANRRREDRRMYKTAVQTLADETGGTFETVIGQGDRAFTRAATSGSALYRVAVEPPPDLTAKAFSVSASVKKPGLTVHANRQAVLPGPAVEETPAERVKAAINEGQPFFNVPIRLAVARRQASGGQVELGIGLEVPAAVTGPLSMTFGLVDQTGTLRSGSRPLVAPAPGADYRLTFPVVVAPGKFSLRFAVADASGGVGSVETSLDAQLTPMGDLSASDVLTWWVDSAGKAQFLALDTVPAGVATLGTGIELYAQPGRNFPEDVKVTMSLARSGAAPLVAKEVAPLANGAMMRAEAPLPLAALPPGEYVLRAVVTAGGAKIGDASALVKIGG